MSRSASWPLAESARRPFDAPRPQPRRRQSRAVWVLVASAFLCGGLLSAAGFAIGWKHEAQRGTSAESALVAATARAHLLTLKLASTRTALLAAQAHATSLAASRRTVAAANAKLADELAAARRSVASIRSAAAPLGGDLDRLTSELHTLGGYLSTTPPGQLDVGYVQAQVAYLLKTVDAFKASVGAVQARAVTPAH